MKKRNLIYSCLIIALGIFAFIYAGRYSSTSNLGSGNTGGDFFPRLMCGGLIITGLAILLTTILSKKGEEESDPIKWVTLLINVSMVLVYLVLFNILGFIVDSIWIVAVLMYRMGCRNKLAIIIWSIAFPVLIFCIFYYLMYVSLPLGILSGILPKY